MVYKVFEEDGDYIRLSDNKRVNVLFAQEAYTPQGLNVGWTEFKPQAALNSEEFIPGFLYQPLRRDSL